MAAPRLGVELVGLPKLQRNLTMLERQVYPKAMSRAINRTATKVRSVAIKGAAKEMGLKQKDVREHTTLRRAHRGQPEARIEMRGRPFNLIRFRARQLKKGVKARPWGKTRTFQGAFIATVRGTEVVFTRERRGGDRVGRLPIRALHGPGIAKTAAEPHLAKARRELVATMLPERLEHELKYAVSRLPR